MPRAAHADGPVIFDVSLNGYRLEHNPLQLMFTPPFLAVTVCAGRGDGAGRTAVVLPLRVGAPRLRAFALGKEALTDNSAQLIRLAGREGHMASRYAALTQKARRPGGRRAARRDRRGADRLLDRMAAQRGLADRLSTLSAEAARAQVGAAGRASLTALARPSSMETGDDA